jgi:uncharacterized protein YjgD (DUF1641 family)
MTTTAPAPPAGGVPVDIATRLDQIAAQLDVLAEEVARQRLEREKWREFQDDVMPVARAALTSLGGELEAVHGVASAEDLLRLARKLAAALPAIEGAVGQLDSLRELGADAAPIVRPAFATLTDRLAGLDERGYFRFAQSGMGIVDRIVTSFSEEDVEALGDNIVLILQTVRDMTQPEVMSFLRRTMQSVQEEETPAEPPSLFGLVREMRDPQVRRGFARALGMLRSMSEAETAAAPAAGATNQGSTDGNGR